MAHRSAGSAGPAAARQRLAAREADRAPPVGRGPGRPEARPGRPDAAGPWERPSWAQQVPARGLGLGLGRRTRRAPPAWLPPTGREVAHAARPTSPRYGNSLRKTLSERERANTR